MSFGSRTPESLLNRNDSKNPATTCKGLTTAGRPCRRALASSANNSPASSPYGKGNGVVAILDAGDAAAFFCWQHKDQAEALTSRLTERTQVLPLKQKSSIDTLIERIGVIELDDGVNPDATEGFAHKPFQQNGRVSHQSGLKKRNTLPREWQNIQGPLMSVPEDVMESQEYESKAPRPTRPVRQRRRTSEKSQRSNAKPSWSCCSSADVEDLPPPRRRDRRYDGQRPRPRSHSRSRQSTTFENPRAQSRSRSETRPQYYQQSTPSTPVRRKQVHQPEMQQSIPVQVNYPHLNNLSDSSLVTPTRLPVRPSISASPPNSQTAALLSLIPPHLSPTTTSALLSELSKPISPADQEGYIYIFWLTPESEASKPDDETASSILDFNNEPSLPKSYSNTNNQRQRQSGRANFTTTQTQLLQRYASINHGPTEPRKILLKIGRASNVHRRLSQWTKQCGQNITLIRYYPYQKEPNHEQSTRRTAAAAVPHVHRVERLIHLELADQRVADKGKCDECGREHKEWFEVEASREGIVAVDEVVRRWVSWAERM